MYTVTFITLFLVAFLQSAHAEPPGVVKEFETREALKQWATNAAFGGTKLLEFAHHDRQFIATSMRHTSGAPSSEVFLFVFRYGRWAALLHLGEPEFDAEVSVEKNRFRVWKLYYTKKKVGYQKRIYVDYDLAALDRQD